MANDNSNVGTIIELDAFFSSQQEKTFDKEDHDFITAYTDSLGILIADNIKTFIQSKGAKLSHANQGSETNPEVYNLILKFPQLLGDNFLKKSLDSFYNKLDSNSGNTVVQDYNNKDFTNKRSQSRKEFIDNLNSAWKRSDLKIVDATSQDVSSNLLEHITKNTFDKATLLSKTEYGFALGTHNMIHDTHQL